MYFKFKRVHLNDSPNDLLVFFADQVEEET